MFCSVPGPGTRWDLDQVGSGSRPVLTLVLGSLVLGQRGCVGEELEADVTLDQGLELPGVAGEHLRVVGSVVVPQTRELLRQQEQHLAGCRSLPSPLCVCVWYLVRLVAELTAKRFGPYMCALVFVQQGGAREHLVTGGAPVKLFGMELLDVLTVLLQRGKTETAFLTVVRL